MIEKSTNIYTHIHWFQMMENGNFCQHIFCWFRKCLCDNPGRRRRKHRKWSGVDEKYIHCSKRNWTDTLAEGRAGWQQQQKREQRINKNIPNHFCSCIALRVCLSIVCFPHICTFIFFFVFEIARREIEWRTVMEIHLCDPVAKNLLRKSQLFTLNRISAPWSVSHAKHTKLLSKTNHSTLHIILYTVYSIHFCIDEAKETKVKKFCCISIFQNWPNSIGLVALKLTLSHYVCNFSSYCIQFRDFHSFELVQSMSFDVKYIQWKKNFIVNEAIMTII